MHKWAQKIETVKILTNPQMINLLDAQTPILSKELGCP